VLTDGKDHERKSCYDLCQSAQNDTTQEGCSRKTHLESNQQQSAASDAHDGANKTSHSAQDPTRGDQRERFMIPGREGR
jgi:hypothetical protein